MIDFEKEGLITMVQAAAMLPGMDGKPMHWRTVWKWCAKGLRGIKLDSLLCGGRRFTSKAALQRFMVAQTLSREEAAKADEEERRAAFATFGVTPGYREAKRRLKEIHGIDCD